MTWKSYALVSGAGILATYLASPPLLPEREVARPRAGSTAALASGPAVDIEEEAARLGARLRAEAAFRAPARDPFRFGDRPVRGEASPGADAPPAVLPPPPPEPPFVVLSGIGTDIVDGIPQRTAILTTTGGVLLVRVGEMVGSDYTVRAIDADRIDLESIADGSIRQLRLPVPAF